MHVIPLILFFVCTLICVVIVCLRSRLWRLFRIRHSNLPSIPDPHLSCASAPYNLSRILNLSQIRAQIHALDQNVLADDESIGARDTLINSYRTERALDVRPARPNLDDISTESYGNVRFTFVSDPSAYYFMLLLANLQIDFAVSGLLRTIVKKFWNPFEWLLGLLHEYGNDYSNVTRTYHNVLIHMPTVSQCYTANACYLETNCRNFRLTLSHKPTPSEKTYFFGRSVLPRILNHLQSREAYQYTGETLLATACSVIYLFLMETHRALPFMDLTNIVEEGKTELAREIAETARERFWNRAKKVLTEIVHRATNAPENADDVQQNNPEAQNAPTIQGEEEEASEEEAEENQRGRSPERMVDGREEARDRARKDGNEQQEKEIELEPTSGHSSRDRSRSDISRSESRSPQRRARRKTRTLIERVFRFYESFLVIYALPYLNFQFAIVGSVLVDPLPTL
jgi:hypothetical protein